jgi:Tol biopolymer transport system component
MNYFDVDRKNQTYKLIRQIWVSYGKPGTARILADNLPQLYIAFKPDSGEILYLADEKIFKLDNILKNLPPVDFDPTQWNYATPYKDDVYVQHEMAWQPNTSLIFLFSHDYWGRGGYTFILNADTGQVCELDFGGWATEAHWSSNGRYLAIGRATKFHPTDLALLDTITGKLTTLNNAPKNEYGQRYLNGFTWAPDNRHLVAIGGVLAPKIGQDNHNVQGLFLIDIDSVQSKMITFAENFYTNSPQSMIWSPNGSKLVFRCPTKEVDRLCFISVRKTEP